VSQQRSEEFRRAAVEKLRSRGSRTVEEVARVVGVSSWSLYQWAKRYGNDQGIVRRNRRPGERSAQEKLQAVIEFEGLEGEKQGEYLRREGLNSDHIAAWKKSMEAGLESGGGGNQATRMERAQDKRTIKELEKELRRKDRALAETTALLVLKKKADLIWGNGENE
jgi:transposase-like protein